MSRDEQDEQKEVKIRRDPPRCDWSPLVRLMLAIFEFNVLHVVHHLLRAYSRLGLCLFALVCSVFTTCISSVSMSDDEEYYEYEEDFMYEDLVPDMVVSNLSLM